MGRSVTSTERGRRLVRVGSIAVLATPTSVLILTQPWHEDRPERFVAVSVILLATLGVHVLVVFQLTSRQARRLSGTLVVSAGAAAVATGVWIVPRLSRPGLPDGTWSAMVAVELGALVAAGFVIVRTRDVGQAVVAGLWTGALSSYLLFASALLAFTFIPASVPDTQGSTVLPSATAAQRLAENRIEAPDGYLVLLAVSCVLTVLVCVAVAVAGRPALARTARP
jgi:hypothetical protein